MGILSWFSNREETRREAEEYHEKQWNETGDAKHLTRLIQLDCERADDEKRKESKNRW